MNLLLFELKKQKKGTKKTSIYFYMLTTYRMTNNYYTAFYRKPGDPEYLEDLLTETESKQHFDTKDLDF